MNHRTRDWYLLILFFFLLCSTAAGGSLMIYDRATTRPQTAPGVVASTTPMFSEVQLMETLSRLEANRAAFEAMKLIVPTIPDPAK